MTTTLTRRRFGKTNLQVSPLGFGGAQIGLLDKSDEEAGRLLNGLLDLGVNVIDTAAMYRTSEELIGRAIASRRDEYVLISKCGHEVEGIDAPAWSAEMIGATVDRSLRSLQTDHLDVMLLHSCDLEVLRAGEALDALVEARDTGKIRFLGYSGDNEAVAHAAGLPEIAVVQTSISICDQRNIELALPICRRNDVGVMAKRPVANAAWKELNDQPGMYGKYAKTYSERLAKMAMTIEEFGLSGSPKALWPEIALRFTLGQQGVSTAIIGTTNPDHVRANMRAAAQPRLDVASVERIRTAFNDAERSDGTTWTGQT